MKRPVVKLKVLGNISHPVNKDTSHAFVYFSLYFICQRGYTSHQKGVLATLNLLHGLLFSLGMLL